MVFVAIAMIIFIEAHIYLLLVRDDALNTQLQLIRDSFALMYDNVTSDLVA